MEFRLAEAYLHYKFMNFYPRRWRQTTLTYVTLKVSRDCKMKGKHSFTQHCAVLAQVFPHRVHVNNSENILHVIILYFHRTIDGW